MKTWQSATAFWLRGVLGFSILIAITSYAVADAEDDQSRLAKELAPLLSCLSGQHEKFDLTADINAKIDGDTQHIDAQLTRFSDNSYDLTLEHKDYAVEITRRDATTAFALPRHKVVFFGKGETDQSDHLKPTGILKRLVSPASKIATFVPLLQSGDSKAVSAVLTGLMNVRYDGEAGEWNIKNDVSFQFKNDGQTIHVHTDDADINLHISVAKKQSESKQSWDGFRIEKVDRDELERQLVRGVRRATEILQPGRRLTSPTHVTKKVEHGELRWIDGQRVALLHGTPEQIGKAHGKLLKDEASRCIDSVLYTFGTVQTIRTGRWFRHDLDDACARLSPHIPERHKVETRALATSLGIENDLAQALNVFPELFHCSGFAVFSTATTDGKLYHGRVLDYMTTIGLQDAATTFIIAPAGQQAFANVGYASFIGSVSGMNANGISLGEMGGRGEGQWDGAPMATLMRRALEECSTLDEVMELWTNSPRTCEYYYVFADGKTNRAVGVSATPEKIEFVLPGEGHELLGPGIKDAVVLSAGSRLETLRQRVTQHHGKIDADVAQWLMSRPVAMQSNLHNVLFVPEDGLLYVANASHDKPAAERPYAKFDLNELLKELPHASPANAVAAASE